MKELDTDMVCEKCRAEYIPVSVDSDNTYFGPSCECWLDDIPKENENSNWIAETESHQQNLEKEAAIHFADLKIKYGVLFYQDQNPINPLHKILLQLENATFISDSDIEWLKKENLAIVVAHSYTRNFQLFGLGWNLVKACKFYRLAKCPCVSLEISKNYYSAERKLMAAISTTRGGAYRDLRQFQNAILCGEYALKLDPNSFHACNMLGATYFQLSDFETGYAYFQLALQKGATLASQNKSLQYQIQGFEMDDKIKVAQFLLQQDPTRYSWAKKYLQQYNSS